MSVKSLLTAIADAIRSKTSSNDTYSLSQIRDFLNMGQKTDNIKDLIERNCSSYTIPSGVTSIGAYAFRGCVFPIRTLCIPDGVTSIGAYAFYDCNLMSVSIPSSVKSIGAYAFYMNSELRNVYCGFAQGAVKGAPWGAHSATIHYNSNWPT